MQAVPQGGESPAEASLERLRSALAAGHKRAALAEQVGVSEGQLSKLLNGELRRFCQIAGHLGLAVYSTDYVEALERALKEKL
jgi:transcriptional regulator with XRE-family HTH domain